MVADNLERYYTTFNIPTHNDLVALGERMKAIEDTLARLESALVAVEPEDLAAVVRPAARRKPAAHQAPGRRRRPLERHHQVALRATRQRGTAVPGCERSRRALP